MEGHLAIRLPDSLPELLLATPLLASAEASEEAPRTWAEASPWSRVTVLMPRVWQALLEREPDSGVTAGGSALVPLGVARDETSALQRVAPDGVLLLEDSWASAWSAWKAKVPIRAGAAIGWRRGLLTHAVVPPTQAGQVVPFPRAHGLRDVGALVGLRPTDMEPRLPVREESAAQLRIRLRELGLEDGERYGVLAPAAGPEEAELWPVDAWADLAGVLALRRGWRLVILSWDQAQATAAEAIVAACAGGPATRRGSVLHVALAEGEFDQLAPLLASAQALVAGARGPQAAAAAFGVPSVTLAGPRPAAVLTPTSSTALQIAGPELECAPCLERVCPLGHQRCLRELSPGNVLGPLTELLRRLEEERASQAAGFRA